MVINKNICNNIVNFKEGERGFLAQNVMSQLRNFVEHIFLKIYSRGKGIENSYSNIKDAREYVESKGEFKFLRKFHDLLQISASHYTLDEENSERLLLKYYEYLLKTKLFLKDKYGMVVLESIDQFPLNTDKKLMEYYEKIADQIHRREAIQTKVQYNDRYYIQKIKPFFVNQQIYYEVTFTRANDKVSKFDRVIAFTDLDISGNYAVRLSVKKGSIHVMGKSMPIHIIDGWEVSIRPCELNNFFRILGSFTNINSGFKGYQSLMEYLTTSGNNLLDLVTSSEEYYLFVKEKMTHGEKNTTIFDNLDRCRELIRTESPGSNVLRYLLLRLNNRVVKQQYNRGINFRLSGLLVSYSCIPFDDMPFNSSLVGHKIRLGDVFECISPLGREHEILARTIQNNTEKRGMLFTPKESLSGFENMEELIQAYNNKLYYKHTARRLEIYKKFTYVRSYVEDTKWIIEKLKELTLEGVKNYTNSVDSWLQQIPHGIDCPDKKEALVSMFESSRIGLIYGAAGTGKSTMIDHISHFFADKEKLFLANTNPAIDNLKRKVTAPNSTFKTIAKFNFAWNADTEYDLLFIDECSTVSNADMKSILQKANFKLLVLVGDIFQIESILFGNWFDLAYSSKDFQSSIFELTAPYRSTNTRLIKVWNKVRNLDQDILEHITSYKYSQNLDESIFDHSEKDEIILCLNYDGLYGINNINSFLQGNNSNESVQWGINTYKVGDPILFNESERFTPLLYNNLKGTLVGIDSMGDSIYFEIELDKAINELDAEVYDFELLDTTTEGNSVIRFSVSKHRSTDEDDDLYSDSYVPFQVAYAVSIHKAQGLEYNSVKIVITDEVGELITHNIFYTAITRAKERLKIYWSPETENKVLSSFKAKDIKRDLALLKTKYEVAVK